MTSSKEEIVNAFNSFAKQTKNELQNLVKEYKNLDISDGPLIVLVVEAFKYINLINFLSPQFNWNEATQIEAKADRIAYGLFVLDLEWFTNYIQNDITVENLQKLAEPPISGWMRIAFLSGPGILIGQVSPYDMNVH